MPLLSENTINPLTHLAHLPRILVLGAALLAAGCAVQPNNCGGVMIGVDTAELFGKQLGGFRLADGMPGSLRHDPSTGAFSVKIGSYRVVPLPNAVGARIAMVAQVEPRPYSGMAPAPAGVNLAARPFAAEHLHPAYPLPPARGDACSNPANVAGRPNVKAMAVVFDNNQHWLLQSQSLLIYR